MAYHLFERHLDEGMFAVAWLLLPIKTLARIYAKLKNDEMAVKMAIKGIDLAQQYYGKMHFQVIGHLNNLCDVYNMLDMPCHELDKLNEIREVYEKKNEQGTI